MADYSNIAKKWRSLSGITDSWANLTSDPIDNDLRQYLIHYGQRVNVLRDAFNDMKKTEGFGLSLFPPEQLFTDTCLEIGNPLKYQVTDFIYARSEKFNVGCLAVEGQSAFEGYVAVATDEGADALGRRDILICWRGTLLKEEFFKDININQIVADELFDKNNVNEHIKGDIRVHEGFFDVYTGKSPDDATDPNKDYTLNSAREQVIAALKRQVDHYAKLNETISITVAGHSLGAALAVLNAMDIVFNAYNKPTGSSAGISVTAFVYACPKVGNKHFVELFDTLQPDLHLLHITNAKDIVPSLPFDLPNLCLFYCHVGENINVDVINSEHVNSAGSIIEQGHQLEVYLYAIASYQGKSKDSELIIGFDFTILNKYHDLLKDSFMIPNNWWGDSTLFRHSMVQMENGFWDVKYDYVPPLPSPVPNIPDEEDRPK